MLRKSRHFCAILESYVPKQWKGASEAVAGSYTGTQNFRSLEASVLELESEKEKRGFFFLPKLDYECENGIPPLFTKRQFDIQYQIFHKDAVERLNTHTIGSELEGHNLDVVIRSTAFDASRAVVHCAAAEHFNYCFWYKSLRPWGTSVPQRFRRQLQAQLSRDSGGMCEDPIKEIARRMTIKGLSQQNQCGWIYLVWDGTKVDVLHFDHGLCPIANDIIPLLCINLHESAFSLDYGANGLENYMQNFFKTCNWIVADRNMGGFLN